MTISRNFNIFEFINNIYIIYFLFSHIRQDCRLKMTFLILNKRIKGWKICFVFILFLINLPSFLSVKPLSTNGDLKPRIYMVLRYDDYTNDSKFRVEPVVWGIAAKYNFTLSVAIVSDFCADPDEIAFIKPYIENNRVEVTCHGLRHAYFPKLPYKNQVFRLNTSKQTLEEVFNVTIETFAAPGNAYTADTLKAIEYTGFKVFSADKLHQDDQLYAESQHPNLIYAHSQWMPWNTGIENITTLINKYRTSTYYKDITKALLICTHFHGVNFIEFPHDERQYPVPQDWIQTNYTEFDQFLHYLSIQKDLEVVTFNQLIEIHEKVDFLNLDLNDVIPQSDNYYSGFTSFVVTLIIIISFIEFLYYLLYQFSNSVMGYTKLNIKISIRPYRKKNKI